MKKVVEEAMKKGTTNNQELYKEVKKKVPEAKWQEETKFKADVRAIKSSYTKREQALKNQIEEGYTTKESVIANYANDSQVDVTKFKDM